VDSEEQARRSDPELKAALHAAASGGASCAACGDSGGVLRDSSRQRGWIGLIGLLLALVIVALLAQKLLKTSGLIQDTEPGAKSTASRGVRGPGEASPAPIDATEATPAPSAAIERARAVESAVQQQAQDMNKRIDDAAK
jgi:hypothetical protein